tara:strand:+ start:360 stop:668 length:309 start_codon:yes stop_codon:yes gene_type:complete
MDWEVYFRSEGDGRSYFCQIESLNAYFSTRCAASLGREWDHPNATYGSGFSHLGVLVFNTVVIKDSKPEITVKISGSRWNVISDLMGGLPSVFDGNFEVKTI